MSPENSRLLSHRFDNEDDGNEGDGNVDETSVHYVILPILWPSRVKRVVLFQVVAHASMASWCASAFIPAFLQMSRVLHCSINQLSYLIGAYTLMMGFGVLIWNPLADRFGRRPVMLVSLCIAIIATCDIASTSIYGRMMVSRMFQGFGICAPLSLGASYIKDMYPPRDRGKALGIWTLGVTAGPFIAPFVSGFIANRANYTWIIWLEALLLVLLLVFEICLLPESLPYSLCYRNIRQTKDIVLQLPRSSADLDEGSSTLLKDYKVPAPFDSFKKTTKAVGYPAVWLCGLGFAVPYGYISVSISSLFPAVYGRLYEFSPANQGLLYLPMLIGSLLAELVAGRLGDRFVAESSRSPIGMWILKKNDRAPRSRDDVEDTEEERVPELRLIVGLVGVLFSIAGLLWFGMSVEMHLHWAHPAAATGLAALGVQTLTSICFSYVIDCYPKTAKEVATVMNIFRVLSSFCVLFYNTQLNGKVGYAWSYFIQSFVTAYFGFGGLILLVVMGGRWR